MKLTARILAALTLALAGTAAAQDGDRLKVATVDMQALFQEFHQTKTTREQFEKEQVGVMNQIKEREARLGEAKQELETLQKQLSDQTIADAKKQTLFTERSVKLQQAEGLQRELDEFKQRKARAIQEQIQLRTKDILEAIRGKVQEHAKSENYDYVFDKSGASTSLVPILLYTKDATDITAVLLQLINKDAPAAAPEGGE
jgi:outer membrane protein